MCPVDTAKYTLEKDKYHIVENGFIETRYGRQEISLPDGAYIIRKLKPIECERLQTLPDGFTGGGYQKHRDINASETAGRRRLLNSYLDICRKTKRNR
ncbi:hypothetical protein EI53_01222 [Fusobacterium naviforme]|nr:hypothetical protein EI53_01222 [Fusobacterium naviforme]STO27570.1 Uncharacterised protein [Fusobacterium naviforme]